MMYWIQKFNFDKNRNIFKKYQNIKIFDTFNDTVISQKKLKCSLFNFIYIYIYINKVLLDLLRINW